MASEMTEAAQRIVGYLCLANQLLEGEAIDGEKAQAAVVAELRLVRQQAMAQAVATAVTLIREGKFRPGDVQLALLTDLITRLELLQFDGGESLKQMEERIKGEECRAQRKIGDCGKHPEAVHRSVGGGWAGYPDECSVCGEIEQERQRGEELRKRLLAKVARWRVPIVELEDFVLPPPVGLDAGRGRCADELEYLLSREQTRAAIEEHDAGTKEENERHR